MAVATDVAPRPSGLDLQIRRRARGLTQEDLAAVAGVTRQRIAYLEALRLPPRAAVEQYERALEAVALERGATEDEEPLTAAAIVEAAEAIAQHARALEDGRR